jgi:hypothetical protein
MSITISLLTPQRIVSGSDSRAWLKTGGQHGTRLRYIDEYCKIDFAGRFVAATTGMAWDNEDRAPNVWAAWHGLGLRDESAAQRADRLVAAIQAQAVHAQGEIHTTVGVFGFSGSVPDGIAFKLRHVPGRTRADVLETTPVPSLPCTCIIGYDELPIEAIIARLNRAMRVFLSEQAMVGLVNDAIAEVERLDDRCGGPIHIGVIDGGGSRWVVP